MPFPYIPLLLSTYLSLSGLRRRSLSPSGALLAFLTGLLTLSLPGPLVTPGLSLVAFYLTGSYATKLGKQRKARLEEGHDEGGAGYRTAGQVFCNSAGAVGACVLWGVIFGAGEGWPFGLGGVVRGWLGGLEGGEGGEWDYARGEWCPVDGSVNGGLSRKLMFVVLGHFATCLGDTLASELGILSRTPPILLTTLRTVPPGTNGGLSILGTAASVGGGAIMGGVMWIGLVAENVNCREVLGFGMGGARGAGGSGGMALVGWGAGAGLVGSMLDSLLGATLQRTQYSTSTHRILTDEGSTSKDGNKERNKERGREGEKEEEEIKVVSGIDVLTNNQVNLVASLATALLLGYLA
ncbi:uncharacterized protein STEHIDRAFT_169791 [Stereum hirsutum FP-91666 SS1]|uniref:uncharacterized protein n=1 Tax=Stereum hirsutum (strain FP-91666) TaxID=721885 RepID=UPI0004449328|nr:uncharacterized protein STEHIDRAFT_169791 [Stereum hirsutum FP-91666 SS1]EIM84929.1 hypothetical protein STEHIDRAFT_169791 [Stereum hirsutum FP-91666 SS1]